MPLKIPLLLLTATLAAAAAPRATAAVDGPPVEDGLRVWLDAASLTARDGEPLAAWPEVVGGAVATSAAADQRPVFQKDAGAGFPALRFDGLPAGEGGDALALPFAPEDAATVFVVFRRDEQSDGGSLNRPLVSSGTIGRGAQQRGLGLTVDRAGSPNRVRAEIGEAPSSQDYGVNDGNFHVAAASFDLGAVDRPTTSRLYLNGVALPPMAADGAARAGPWTIGGGDDASVRDAGENRRRFAGAIAEVLIYEIELGEDSVQAVSGWLGRKHGIETLGDDTGTEGPPPFAVEERLFDQRGTPALGLATVPATHATVFEASTAEEPKFNHQVKVFGHGGWLYAHWQAAARDEDATDSYVLWSRSRDGETWETPRELAPPSEGRGIRTSGGWWASGGELTAFFNSPNKPGVGRVTEYRVSPKGDGERWGGIVDGPPKASLVGNPTPLPDGRLVALFLGSTQEDKKPGTVIQLTSDPTGRTGWTPATFPRAATNRTRGARGVEPALFVQADGDLVVVLRDMHGSGRSLATVSTDGGDTWAVPVLTAMPDSGSMQCAGNLPDGTAYLVNVPTPTTDLRVPLAVTLSRDGETFTRSLAIRTAVPEIHFPGLEKLQGYSYPHACVWDGALWVAYATCKERIEVSRIALEDLHAD